MRIHLTLALLAFCSALSIPVGAKEYEPSTAELEYQRAYDEWALGLTRYLASVDDPLVNVLASGYLDFRSKELPELEDEARAVRAVAWTNGQANPAVILRVYGKDCISGQVENFCDAVATRNHLLALDPDNAALVLLPWLFPNDSSTGEPQLTAQNVALLVEASRMKSFDLYVTAGFFDAYQAMERYPKLDDRPGYSQELLDLIAARGLQMPADPLWEPSAAIISYSYYWPRVSYVTLTNFCRQAESEKYEEAITACLDLADLMQDSARTSLEETMGYAVRKVVERPDYIGAAKENLDPERWRDRVRHLEFDCARPRLLYPGKHQPMPTENWSLYMRDLQEFGEIVANRRAAEREYARHPEAFVMNPAECSRIHELDEATQKQLAGEKEIEQLKDALRYMKLESDNGMD